MFFAFSLGQRLAVAAVLAMVCGGMALWALAL